MEPTLLNESPEKAVHEAAKQVSNESAGKCNGVAIQTLNEESGEVVLTIHIVTPRLSNYSYRLIEVSSNDLLERYPVKVTLFGKDPKNRIEQSCSSYKELVKHLNFLLAHPLSKMLYTHIHNMGMLTARYRVVPRNIILSSSPGFEEFTFITPNRPIIIRQITLDKFFNEPSNIWLGALQSTNLILTCTSNFDNRRYDDTIALIRFVSPYINKPVFQTNITFPSNTGFGSLIDDPENTLTYRIRIVNSKSENVQVSISLDHAESE